MAQCHERLGKYLDATLPAATTHPAHLHEAMRYAVLGEGKRIRPTLVYAGGLAVGANQENLDAPAGAIEFIHAYSLIHDDLPAMDNDDLRRGRASCHRAFDESTAILAGDALQSLAFQVLANMAHTPREGRELFLKLSKATDRFLDVMLTFMGSIPYDAQLRKAVQLQRAVVDAFPRSPSAQALKRLARQVIEWPESSASGGQLEFFVERLINSETGSLEVVE